MQKFNYTVWGLKLAKREPIIHYMTGEVIDDGVNRELILMQNDRKQSIDFFIHNIRKHVHHRSWKIWVVDNHAKVISGA